jgi:cytochrome c55X
MGERVLVVAGLLCLASLAARAEPPIARQDQLLYRLRQDCGSCHGMTLKGGLGPPLLPGAIAAKADDALVDVILRGVAGTPMPPWDVEISRDEAAWLVQRLREGLHEG